MESFLDWGTRARDTGSNRGGHGDDTQGAANLVVCCSPPEAIGSIMVDSSGLEMLTKY